jgi:quinoprotein dehydrogenase-associated probable ABC transporter substrate-binding protein
VLLLLLLAPAAGARTLRVAADPNNLPFTNARGEGFENALATLLAEDLGARVEYDWHAQRRGFFRRVFQEQGCDLVLGVPVGFERARVTAPYYRSSYVFVTRADRGLALRSLDDPRLRALAIGVPLVGDDGADPPPALALAARGIVANVQGFPVYGDYSRPNPPERVLEALEAGTLDVAIVWGPVGGAFAHARPGRFALAPVTPDPDPVSGLGFTFAIGMGVRRADSALAAELDAFLVRRRADVAKILDAHGIYRGNEP